MSSCSSVDTYEQARVRRLESSESESRLRAGNRSGPGQMSVVFCMGALAAGMSAAIWPEAKAQTNSDRFVPPRGALTFTRDIAPIIFQNCSTCHRPGQSAPFNLLNYQEVRKHQKEIAEVTAQRYMPPWLPEPGYGDFAGARLLSTRQIGM